MSNSWVQLLADIPSYGFVGILDKIMCVGHFYAVNPPSLRVITTLTRLHSAESILKEIICSTYTHPGLKSTRWRNSPTDRERESCRWRRGRGERTRMPHSPSAILSPSLDFTSISPLSRKEEEEKWQLGIQGQSKYCCFKAVSILTNRNSGRYVLSAATL